MCVYMCVYMCACALWACLRVCMQTHMYLLLSAQCTVTSELTWRYICVCAHVNFTVYDVPTHTHTHTHTHIHTHQMFEGLGLLDQPSTESPVIKSPKREWLFLVTFQAGDWKILIFRIQSPKSKNCPVSSSRSVQNKVLERSHLGPLSLYYNII